MTHIVMSKLKVQKFFSEEKLQLVSRQENFKAYIDLNLSLNVSFNINLLYSYDCGVFFQTSEVCVCVFMHVHVQYLHNTHTHNSILAF